MALFEWNENFLINIESIDVQHKKLVDLVNELHDCMKHGKGKEVINQVLEELITYTKYHFKTEEEYFVKYNYSETKEHIKAHQEFIDKVMQFVDQHQKSKLISITVFNFLVEWVRNHILQVDKRYSEFLKSKGVN